MRYRSLSLAALAALVIAACGSSSSSSEPAGPRAWTLADVLRLSGMHRNSDGLTYSLPAHPRCVVRILLRSTAEVQTYEAAGDVIATNPDQSAGARVEPGEPAACKTVLTRAFAHVR